MLLEQQSSKNTIQRGPVARFENDLRYLPDRIVNQELLLSLEKAYIYIVPKTYTSLVALFQNDGCYLLLPKDNNSDRIPLHADIAKDHHLEPGDDVLRGFIIISNARERFLIADLKRKNIEEVASGIHHVFEDYQISAGYFHSDFHLSSSKQRSRNVHIGNFTGVFDAFRKELIPENQKNERYENPITNTELIRRRLLQNW